MYKQIWLGCVLLLLISHLSFLSAATVGWRTDNSGFYAVDKSPLTWSDTEHVLWREKMPAWSNTSPIIIGNKIFTCAEPAILICSDKTSGKILWQAGNEYKDLADPTDADALNSAGPKLAELEAVQAEADKVQGKLRKDRDNAELIASLTALKEKEKFILTSNPSITKFKMPKTHRDNGFCSYIPVSDGQFIYAAYGIGTLACYTMDGKRVWGLIGQKPEDKFGGSTSPVLATDVVIIGFKDYVAYDKKTGAERWRVAMKNQSYGTPIIITLGGEEVLITPQGIAVKISDGSILEDKLFTATPYNAPIFHDGILYVVGGGENDCSAVKVPNDVSGEFEKLWSVTVQKDRYYSSPLLHNGLLYVIHRSGQFSVLDSKNGDILTSNKIAGLKANGVYTSPTGAGEHIYIGDETGLVVVFKAGKALEEVSRNQNESTRCSPVFEGNKMYMRTNNHLVCIEAP